MVGQWATVFYVHSKYTTSRYYSYPGIALSQDIQLKTLPFGLISFTAGYCRGFFFFFFFSLHDHLPELSPPQRWGTNRIKPGRASRAAAQSSSSQRRGEGAERDTFLLMNVAQFRGRQDAFCCKTSLPPFLSRHVPNTNIHHRRFTVELPFFLLFFFFFFFFNIPCQHRLAIRCFTSSRACLTQACFFVCVFLLQGCFSNSIWHRAV